jgi:hypothetical protein
MDFHSGPAAFLPCNGVNLRYNRFTEFMFARTFGGCETERSEGRAR